MAIYHNRVRSTYTRLKREKAASTLYDGCTRPPHRERGVRQFHRAIDVCFKNSVRVLSNDHMVIVAEIIILYRVRLLHHLVNK